MAQRKAVVDIDIKGLNTVQDLEQYISDINEELKDVDINSDAFNQLSSNAAQAAGKLKGVNAQLEGVTSTEKAEGILKMGEGFAGALIGVQGLSMALGENNEELQKTIQKVGGLVLAMDGMRKVTEAFSAENMKRLRGVGRSFTTLVKTVKTSSLAMRSALIATGIGALVVAVGLLIANWDKLTGMITGKRREKQLQRDVDLQEQQVEYAQERLNLLNQQIAAESELAGLNNDKVKIEDLKTQGLEEQLTLIKEEQKLNIANIKLAENKKIKEGKFAIVVGEVLAQQTGIFALQKKGYTKMIDALIIEQNKIRIMEQENKTLAAQEKLIERQLALQEALTKTAKIRESILNYIFALEKEISVLNAQGEESVKIYRNQVEIINEQVASLNMIVEAQGFITDEQTNQLRGYQTQLKVLEIIEQKRIKQLKLDLSEIEARQKYNKLQDERYALIEAESDIIQRNMFLNNVLLDDEARKLETIEREIGFRDYITQQQISMIPFDKKGLEILEKRLGLTSDDVKLRRELNGINKLNAELTEEGLVQAVDASKLSDRQYLTFYAQVKALNDVYDANVASFNVQLENNKALEDALLLQQKRFFLIAGAAGAQAKEQERLRDIALTEAQSTTNLEKQLKFRQEAEKYDTAALQFRSEQAAATNEALQIDREINALAYDNSNIQGELNKLSEDKLNTEQQISYEIEQQTRGYARMQTFIGEFNAELQASIGIINAGFELYAAFADRRREMAQREHDEAMENIAEIDDAMGNQENQREEYLELLKDANGEYYDELLDKISEIDSLEAQQNDARAEYEKQRLIAQNKMEWAEYQAAVARKTTAIIDATIQGALAVVSALPNVVLAALTGVLAAAGVIMIASQPTPPKPSEKLFVEGGHTGEGGKYEPAGIVHKGEYVVPQDIVDSRTGAEMIGTLEAMRTGMKGYAEGGNVTAPQNNLSSQATEDFNILAEKIAESLRRNPSVVSVVEITDSQNKVKVIKQNATM